MFAMLAAAAVLSLQSDAAPDPAPDGRGWAIRCAVTAHYVKDFVDSRADRARLDDNARGTAALDAESAKLEQLYQQALAAPYDIPTATERFALARQFREWVSGPDDEELEDVLAACEVALSMPDAMTAAADQ